MQRFKNKKWLIGAILFGFIVFAVWQGSNIITTAEPLTVDEATDRVRDLYQGEIVDVQEGKNSFFITIELTTGRYEIEIDRESGDIGRMTRTSKLVATDENQQVESPGAENTEKQGDHASVEPPSHAQEEPVPSSPHQSQPEAPVTPNKAAKYISESEAIKIALSQISGKVDDVEIESSDEGVYYLVEIEHETSDDDDEEATVQIHAITGEVMSIVWDD